MEKKEIFIFGLLCFSALVFAAEQSIEKRMVQQWKVQDYWQKLEVKQTDTVVTELLGEPVSKEDRGTSHIWHYQQGQKGLLMFKQVNGDYLLYKWMEPDWTITAPHTERQYLAEQSRIETERKREEARQDRERIRAERITVKEQ